MNISLSWLKEYVDVPWNAGELGDRLTAVGLEVESIEDQAKVFEGFVVGEVLSVGKHPKADRLTVCEVSTGTETLQIVCGAPNVAKGQKVPVGLVGATVPHDQHDPDGKPFVLSKVKIRGVESSGMICSAHELGLGDDADGILVLDPKAPVGTPLASFLGRTDTVLEIGITPNRSDCLSHIGVAREVAMLTRAQVRTPKGLPKESGEPASKRASVTIEDPDLCPRYCGRVLSGVKLGPSPAWMQLRLTAAGVRPLNVVVDVTNYVMLELGQPLHAFDLKKLRKGAVIVRRAGKDKEFTTLDGKKRTLSPDTIMICDPKGPVAVGGVMGGENSEIGDDTTDVLIESASFLPSSIRRTARAFALSTEASYRFERGVDPELASVAADRAAALLQELTGATVHPGLLDAYPGRRERSPITLRPGRTNEILGTDLSGRQMQDALTLIGCSVSPGADGKLSVVPPSYRLDIGQEIDLVEEVARVQGYDNIETKTRAAIDFSVRADDQGPDDVIRSVLVGFGYSEIVTVSLLQRAKAEAAGGRPIEVLRPVSAEMQVLRTSLLPAALEVVRSNVNRSRATLRLFEVGNVFSLREGQKPDTLENIEEEERLILVQTGVRSAPAFDATEAPVDLFDLKGEVEALFRRLYLDKYRFILYDGRNTLTEQTLTVEINGRSAGWLGKVSGGLAEKFDVDVPVFACELNIAALGIGFGPDRRYVPLPRYPSVQRDLAFVVDDTVSHESLESALRSAAGPMLEDVRLFDVYQGTQVGKGKKSLAYALTFRSDRSTLRDEDVDTIIASIVRSLREAFDATLRT